LSEEALNDAHFSSQQAELNELRIEHRDLDQVIDHLTSNPPPDQLLIRRLKKRKLLLKDRILLLESLLEPDIPA
jgi:hypothetical protein